MTLESNKSKGRFGLAMAMAIAYFTSEGYTISTPLNDTQWYDLIIERDGNLRQYNVNVRVLKIIL